jgi:hypothetical protein
MILAGQLSTELLIANNANQKERSIETIRRIRSFRNIKKFIVMWRVGKLQLINSRSKGWLICTKIELKSRILNVGESL